MPDQSGFPTNGAPVNYNQVVTPAVPAANTVLVNNTGQDAMVYVSGGVAVAVSVNGVATGLAAGSFYVQYGGTINLGPYTGAPTWHWIAI